MKVSLLIFLLVSTTIFAQERHYFFDYFAVEEMILGEWELEKKLIVDSDSFYCEINPKIKQSLNIDSNRFFLKSTLQKSTGIYNYIQLFYHKVSLNHDLKIAYLHVYYDNVKKIKKKTKAISIYEIEKLDFNHLILKDIKRSALTTMDSYNPTYLVYKRKQTNKFSFDDFAGTWHLFGEKGFTFESNDEIVKLNREIDTLAISKLGYQTEWQFNFQGLRNSVFIRTNVNPFEIKTPNKHWVFSDAGNYEIIDAVYIAQNKEWNKLNFWIDFKNQLIFLLHESISVYHFDFDEQGALILSYDENRTKNLKKIER